MLTLFELEMLACLPYVYVLKIWMAHNEFMEDLNETIS